MSSRPRLQCDALVTLQHRNATTPSLSALPCGLNRSHFGELCAHSPTSEPFAYNLAEIEPRTAPCVFLASLRSLRSVTASSIFQLILHTLSKTPNLLRTYDARTTHKS